jgi:hypothetical protein
MDKEPSVIFFIHFHAMVFLLDGRLLQKANHTAAQLPAPLSGNDLYHLYFFSTASLITLPSSLEMDFPSLKIS